MEPRITLVTLGVVDLEHALRFYRDGLGWVPSPASVAGDVAFFQAGGLVVALWSREALADDARLPRDDGWGAVAPAPNVASRAAGDGGVPKAQAATDWGGHSGYVADPDGQPWEIAHNPFWPLQADGTVRPPS